jgi:hypothetical protein
MHAPARAGRDYVVTSRWRVVFPAPLFPGGHAPSIVPPPTRNWRRAGPTNSTAASPVSQEQPQEGNGAARPQAQTARQAASDTAASPVSREQPQEGNGAGGSLAAGLFLAASAVRRRAGSSGLASSRLGAARPEPAESFLPIRRSWFCGNRRRLTSGGTPRGASRGFGPRPWRLTGPVLTGGRRRSRIPPAGPTRLTGCRTGS